MIMKRDIKFRTYDIEFKEYNEYHFNRTSLRDFIKWNDRFFLEQYTGLKDKNGVEIYEGDIIEVPDDYDTYGMNAGEKYEIFFNAGGFRCKPKINPKAKGIWLEDDCEFLIIGNIHENPEILNQPI